MPENLQTQIHTIAPVYAADSRVLILGSFPSVRSRADGFFYAHPQNRFWRVLAAVFDEPVPQSVEEKMALLHAHRIALWDVAAQCSIAGSGDASMRDVIPNDIAALLTKTQVVSIFVNGQTAAKYYRRLIEPTIGIPALVLPSTSAANASQSLEALIESWRIIKTEK